MILRGRDREWGPGCAPLPLGSLCFQLSRRDSVEAASFQHGNALSLSPRGTLVSDPVSDLRGPG